QTSSIGVELYHRERLPAFVEQQPDASSSSRESTETTQVRTPRSCSLQPRRRYATEHSVEGACLDSPCATSRNRGVLPQPLRPAPLCFSKALQASAQRPRSALDYRSAARRPRHQSVLDLAADESPRERAEPVCHPDRTT